MIQILMLGRDHGHDNLREGIETALELGCSDSAAVSYLVTAGAFKRVPPEVIDVGALSRYERPLPTLGDYNRLLTPEMLQ